MGSLKKFDGSSWINSNLRKLSTDTDTFTTFPAIIYAEGTNATVGLKGNTVQPGTPTPDTPIMPQGTGEKTGNLADVMPFSAKWATIFPNLVTFLNQLAAGNYTLSYDIELTQRNNVSDNSTYGIAIIGAIAQYTLRWDTAEVGTIRRVSHNFTISTSMAGNIERAYAYGCGINGVGATGEARISNIMLNLGSTPLPYEPYGYKLDISSADTTTPVYLGEVETTRKIKKLVFDGTENVTYNSKNDARERWVVTIPTPNGTTTPENVICTHFNTVDNATKPLSEGGICMRITGGDVVVGGLYTDIDITSPSDSTTIVNAVKAYLATQYAAGTPVTIWYVLATEETGIVNEPLMKIGDYADTVSGISIPVTAGGDTLSVGTTVQPSEVTANYYGWHTITVHERASGQWD